MATRFETHYMDNALFRLDEVIERAKGDLSSAFIDFDTIVGTGFSGGVVIPALALAMGKNFVLVRKDGDDSHHGGGKIVGQLGERWIFVDDLICSGQTRRRVMRKIQDAEVYKGWEAGIVRVGRDATFVGQYMYSRVNPYFQPASEIPGIDLGADLANA